MRSKNPELMKSIQSYVNQYCLETSRTPSVSEIANALGISKGSAQNYLKEMDEKQMISYQGGELKTRVSNKCRTDQVGVPIADVNRKSSGYVVSCPNCGKVHQKSITTESIIVCSRCGYEYYLYLKNGVL